MQTATVAAPLQADRDGKVVKVAQAISNLNGVQPAEDAAGPYEVIARALLH